MFFSAVAKNLLSSAALFVGLQFSGVPQHSKKIVVEHQKSSHLEFKDEDVVIQFEQQHCGQEEKIIFKNAFPSFFKYIFPSYSYTCRPLYKLKENADYESGNTVCVRAYAYIKTNEEISEKVLLGFALVHKDVKPERLYIEYICVSEKCKKRGIGKKLIEELGNHFKPTAIRLESVSAALGFYKKIEFEQEEDKHHFEQEEDKHHTDLIKYL
jgi:ribosomal protein S18 acetylase RimI-like enzyme